LKNKDQNSPPNYHIIDYNCTTFSYNVLIPYLNLPSGKSDIGIYGYGRNPANMCEDLRYNAGAYGNKLTSGNELTAPSNINCN
jgi:hypothetical protein